jgi:hypothetical protein
MKEAHMSKFRIIPLIIITAVFTCAFMAPTGGNSESPAMAREQDDRLRASQSHDAKHHLIALHDVSAHVAQHYPGAMVDESTLVEHYGWTADWELRFVEAIHENGVLHYAHAMHRNHPNARFLAHWDSEHGTWHEWEPVQ